MQKITIWKEIHKDKKISRKKRGTYTWDDIFIWKCVFCQNERQLLARASSVYFSHFFLLYTNVL